MLKYNHALLIMNSYVATGRYQYKTINGWKNVFISVLLDKAIYMLIFG